MNECCATSIGDERRCPTCGAAGAPVGAASVQAHRPDAATVDWWYCPNLSCHVVFFADAETITDNVVVTQVGLKATDKPTPVCFCFAHTAADIAADLAENGTSTISADIRAAVAAGSCACEHLNPSGKCCLPDIHRVVVAARRTNNLFNAD